MKHPFLLLPLTLLAACQQNDTSQNDDATDEKAATASGAAGSAANNGLKFADADGDLPLLPAELDMMPIQIALERLGFSPGVIDGKTGDSLKIALKGFQKANDIAETGEVDAATKAVLERAPMVPATRLVRIADEFASQQFFPDLPKDAAEQAKLPALGYRNMMEALAERFHTTPETLVALNSPGTKIGAPTASGTHS